MARAKALLSPETPLTSDQLVVMAARSFKRISAKLATVKSQQDIHEALADALMMAKKLGPAAERIEDGE